MIELRDRYPTLYRALKAVNSNKDTTVKERIYGALIALLFFIPLILNVNKDSALFRLGVTFGFIFLPRLIVEFTYYPLRELLLTIIKRKRG